MKHNRQSTMSGIKRGDTVVVQGRYLYKFDDIEQNNSSQRFFVKGVAFPNAPSLPPPVGSKNSKPQVNYNATAWIDVLKQLRQALPSEALNAVRLYQMDPDVDYSEFFQGAADLGFYIMVPLTANSGDAVLNRLARAPKCYPRELFKFGQHAIRSYMRYPNVLAGLIGNEVMNSIESWVSAPCIKAYARDLKLVMHALQQEMKSNPTLAELYVNRTSNDGELLPIPLMYAAQDSGIGAALDDVDTVRLTLDYLSCEDDIAPLDDKNYNISISTSKNDDVSGSASIDIFGVNVESWCATDDTFHYNDDGTIGAFYKLWQGLHDGLQVPLIFSEMGCSHEKFNHDTPALRTPEGTRDWTEVPVVLHDMIDTWSGFSAYAYWGNSLFNMMKDGPWNGISVLEPAEDFFNFQKQSLVALNSTTSFAYNNSVPIQLGTLQSLPMQNGGIMEDYYHMLEATQTTPTCQHIQDVLRSTSDVKLYDLQKMPSYADSSRKFTVALVTIVAVLVGIVILQLFRQRRQKLDKRQSYELIV